MMPVRKVAEQATDSASDHAGEAQVPDYAATMALIGIAAGLLSLGNDVRDLAVAVREVKREIGEIRL